MKYEKNNVRILIGEQRRKKLEIFAENKNHTISTVIRLAIDEYLENHA